MDIGGNSKRLRALIGSKPTRETEAFVVEQLGTRRSGLESLAARVLSSWARKSDREHVKRWFRDRMLDRAVGFRPDLVQVLSCLRDDDDVAFLVEAFAANRSHRATIGHVLRDLPQAFEIARELIERDQPQLAADAIERLMWSRARYGRALKVLAGHENALVRRAATNRQTLFSRFPDEYR